MIELIQVHDLGSAMEDGRTTINIPIAANILTENTVILRRNFAGAKTRRRDITANCNGETMKVNVTFGNPDNDLKNRKITFQEYADMKANYEKHIQEGNVTHYNDRMVTEYEKESKPAEPPQMERTKANFYGKMGSYDLKDDGITLEPGTPEPLPWSQRFFRFFGRR